MENSYDMYQNVSFSKSKLWQTLGLGHLIQVESWIIFVQKEGVFLLEKVRQHKKLFIVKGIRRCFKRRHSKKLCYEGTSRFALKFLFEKLSPWWTDSFSRDWILYLWIEFRFWPVASFCAELDVTGVGIRHTKGFCYLESYTANYLNEIQLYM